MFDLVHKNKKLMQGILALVILPFAFWGVDSYNQSGNTAEVVATVNDAKITQREFDNALSQQQDRLRQILGANYDAAMLENPDVKRAVMDNLVGQRLLTERAKAVGLIVSDVRMAQVIQSIEGFQDNGKFDKKRYENALANQGMSPLMFEARLRSELLGQQMRDTYIQNGFASRNVADNVTRLYEQQRTVSTSSISFQDFIAQAKVDDAALKQYYEQNQKAFQVPEQAKVEYVTLSVENLLEKVESGVDEARKYYDEHQSEFGAPEERQAAHILVAADAAAPQVEQNAAKAKAEQLLQQIIQNPGSFAELAKQHSQDPGSAASGGDLGFFGHGMMVKPFEDATFALNKPGEISALVKSDFGYHIIKLLAIKPAKILPFDEVREGVTGKLRQRKALDLFAELAEKFSNIVYEQSDTLKPAAELTGTKIEQSGWLVKGNVADDLWTAKMLQAVFADETVKDKRNTPAIEVAANTLVAARILEHKPASVQSLDEAQDMIRQKLLRQHAMELAVKHGESLLEQLRHGDKPKLEWGSNQTISRVQPGTLHAELSRKIFQLDAGVLPGYVGVEIPENGYMLARIESVKEIGQQVDEKRANYAQKLRRLTGEEMFRAFLSDAKQQAAIDVKLVDATSENGTGQP